MLDGERNRAKTNKETHQAPTRFVSGAIIKYYTKKDVLKNRFISNYFMLAHLVP